MSAWLFKTEPDEYSFQSLQKEGKATWNGVRNNAALKNLRAIKKGDTVFIYHTGGEKQIVGLAKVTAAAYPDPKEKDEKLVVVDLAPLKPVNQPVTLQQLKEDARFKAFDLVRISRLSVMPVPAELEKILLKLAGLDS